MAFIFFSTIIIILFILAIIDYHNDPPTGLNGGL